MSDDLAARAHTAIRTLKKHRTIHERWLEFCVAKPDYDGDAGNAQHHREAIANYDQMIQVMNDLVAERSPPKATTCIG